MVSGVFGGWDWDEGWEGEKRGPSWERAMKRVRVVFRARVRSWKGRRGGCGVWVRTGLRRLRSGGGKGRVRVWSSRVRRVRKVR